MTMDSSELTDMLAHSSVHSSALPSRRTVRMRSAHSRSRGLPAVLTTSSWLTSRPMTPSVRPEHSAEHDSSTAQPKMRSAISSGGSSTGGASGLYPSSLRGTAMAAAAVAQSSQPPMRAALCVSRMLVAFVERF